MDREHVNELKKNTLIIAIANLGSKAIVFFLAPLYSFFLTTEQYGTMDLITTTAGLLVPFVCFDIFEATFRYSSESSYEKEKVLSSSLAVTAVGSAVACIVMVLTAVFGNNTKYVLFTGFFAIIEAINSVIRQFARGKKQMGVFAFSGVVDALGLLASNIVSFRGLSIIFLRVSYLIGKVLATGYLIISTKSYRYFSIKKIDKNYIKQFVKFCVPLLPTATMWWIMNASDRYVIAFFLGASATGIYSVANKIPAILSVFENVFYQAWQTTAIGVLNNKDRDEFYSRILTNYILLISTGTITLLVIVKPVINILFAKEYSEAWICLPALLVGIIFHAIGGNLGSLYTVFKQTKGAFVSTLLGALVNTGLNFIIIPAIGIGGAALTTLIGYIVTYVYRWFDVKKFVKLKLEQKRLIPIYIALPIQCVLFYWDIPISYILRTIIALVVILCNYKTLIGLIVRR